MRTLIALLSRFGSMLGTVLVLSVPAEGLIILNATNRGNYIESSGGAFSLNSGDSTSTANYNVGDPFTNVTRESRDFFVFDLSSVTGVITGAELRLFNPSNGFGTTQSGDGSETFDVFDATWSADLLSGANATSTFADLGSGTLFGTKSVSTSDNATTIVVVLNSSALAALNSASGSFAFGGAVTSLVDPFVDEREQVFGFTGSGSSTQLALDVVVPEPTSLALLAFGCLGLGLHRQRIKVR